MQTKTEIMIMVVIILVINPEKKLKVEQGKIRIKTKNSNNFSAYHIACIALLILLNYLLVITRTTCRYYDNLIL